MKNATIGKYPHLEIALCKILKHRQDNNPLASMAIIVPNISLKYHLEKNITRKLEGFTNIFFFTLSDFAREVFEFSSSKNYLLKNFQCLFIEKALTKITNDDYLEKLVRSNNAALIIATTINVLKKYNLAAQEFMNIAIAKNSPKWQEIATLYLEYENLLAQYGFCDTYDCFKCDPTSYAQRFSCLALYGFFEHSLLEHEFLAKLFSHPQIFSYIPFRRHPAYNSVQKVISWYYENGFKIHDITNDTQFSPSKLDNLIQQVFVTKEKKSVFDVTVTSCRNEVDEIDYVTNHCLKNKSDTLAIILPPNKIYYNCIQNCCLDAKLTLNFIYSKVESIAPQANMLRTLLCTLIDYNENTFRDLLAEVDFDWAKIVAQENPTIASIENDLLLMLHGESNGIGGKNKEKTEHKSASEIIYIYCKQIEETLRKQQSFFEMLEYIVQVLETISKQKQLAKELEEIFSIIVKINFLEPTLENLEKVFALSMENIVLQKEQHQDILAGELRDMIGANLSSLTVTGAMEQYLPNIQEESTLFTKEELVELDKNMEQNNLPLQEKEKLLFLLLLDSTENIMFSHAQKDYLLGKEYQPSPFLLEILSFSQHQQKIHDRKSIADSTPQTLLEYDIFLLQKSIENDTAALTTLFSVYPHWQNAIESLNAKWQPNFTRFDGIINSYETRERIKKFLPQENIAISASFLEDYAHCPYQFFLSRILKIKNEPIYSSIPQISHRERKKLLLKVVKKCKNIEKKDIAKVVQEIIADFELDFPTDYKMLWDIEKLKFSHALDNYAKYIFGEQYSNYFFVEYKEPQNVSVTINTNKKIHFHGIIDQVDTTQQSSYGIQYRWAKPRQVKNNCLYAGQQLQLAIELLALEKTLKLYTPQQIEYRYIQENGDYKQVFFDQQNKDTTFDQLQKICFFLMYGIENGFFFAFPERQKCRNCKYIEVCGPYRHIIYQSKEEDPRISFFQQLSE